MNKVLEMSAVAWAKGQVGDGFTRDEYLSMTMTYIQDKVSNKLLFILFLGLCGIIIGETWLELQFRKVLEVD